MPNHVSDHKESSRREIDAPPSHQASDRAPNGHRDGSDYRERRSIWNRLENIKGTYNQRSRNELNSTVLEQRKRRYEESVATSSWKPYQTRNGEEDSRNNVRLPRISPPTRRPPYKRQRETGTNTSRHGNLYLEIRPYSDQQARAGDHRHIATSNHQGFERESNRLAEIKRKSYQWKQEHREKEDRSDKSNRVYEVRNRLGKKILYREKSGSPSRKKDERAEHKKNLPRSC